MIAGLALADLRHDWKMFACYAIALSAVLAPLMVLYGLKHGVVSALTAQLLADPANREVLVVGNRRYETDWLARLAAREEVGFLAPRTRSIAASIYVSAEPGARTGLIAAELIPTGEGDPLLAPGTDLEGRSVALSRSLADALGVGVGERIGATAVRQAGDRSERADLAVEVTAVLPPGHLQRRALLAPLAMLEAFEDFRDGFAVPRYGWPGEAEPPPRAEYASFRLYAADLDAVAPLADRLSEQGIEVRSRAAEIANVQRLDASFTRIFAIIAGLGGVGYLLSLGANLWSNVERKRRDLSLIRLLGFSGGALMRFPAVQAVAISAVGVLVAFGFFFMAQRVINVLYTVPELEGQSVCTLLPVHFAIAAGATLISAAAASTLAGWRATRVQPAEGMRDV
jgi:putative ABC transport system permease protein